MTTSTTLPGIYFMAGAFFALVSIVLLKAAYRIVVFRSPREPIERDPTAPLFGSNAIPWFASLIVGLILLWLVRNYLDPIMRPYIGAFVNLAISKLSQ